MILDFFTKLHNDTEAPKAESFIAVSKAQNVILVEGLPFEIPSKNFLKFRSLDNGNAFARSVMCQFVTEAELKEKTFSATFEQRPNLLDAILGFVL